MKHAQRMCSRASLNLSRSQPQKWSFAVLLFNKREKKIDADIKQRTEECQQVCYWVCDQHDTKKHCFFGYLFSNLNKGFVDSRSCNLYKVQTSWYSNWLVRYWLSWLLQVMYVLVCTLNLSRGAIRQHNNTKQTTWPATENNIPPKTQTREEPPHLLFLSQEKKEEKNPIMCRQVNVSALKSGLIRGKSDRGRRK